MTTKLPTTNTHQGAAAKYRSPKGGVGGRLKVALDSIVHQGLAWDEAAVKAGLTVRSMRLALKRPAVLAYLKGERHVLVTTIRAENPRRLKQLRDQDANAAAAVRAALAIETIGDGDAVRSPGLASAPGITILVVAAPNVGTHVGGAIIDVTPARETPDE